MGSKDETKRILLEAGRELLVEKGLAEEIDLKLTEVLERVNMTTGAAYNIWANQSEYRADLALHIAQGVHWADAAPAAAALSELPADATMYDWVLTVCETYFPIFVSTMNFFVVLKFWGVKHPSPELADAIQDGYANIHQEFGFLYEHFLATYDRRVVPPYTVDDLTTMIAAAIEGSALRHRFDPERLESASGHLFTSIASAIVTVYTEPDGK